MFWDFLRVYFNFFLGIGSWFKHILLYWLMILTYFTICFEVWRSVKHPNSISGHNVWVTLNHNILYSMWQWPCAYMVLDDKTRFSSLFSFFSFYIIIIFLRCCSSLSFYCWLGICFRSQPLRLRVRLINLVTNTTTISLVYIWNH